MPVPLQRLAKQHKLNPKSLKAAFDADKIAAADKSDPTRSLVDDIRDTIQNGIDRNRRDYRLFKALDWAYDSPFYQISYTQLKGLLSSNPDSKKVQEVVNEWGLTHLLPDVTDADGKACCGNDGKPLKGLNLPVFFNIFVPIVMAYVTIRWAKLFNDRNLVPLYKYEPVQFTKENRLRCEVVTQIVQRQSTWFGYGDDLRQSILQTLLYGFCINFPREAWYSEKQEDEKGEEVIVREGLRFNLPHPSRIYWDLYHRLSTLNNNSGCAYAGYWELVRYKDINSNPLYWNKDKIGIGAASWFDLKSDPMFLKEVFPCNMTFPDLSQGMGMGGTGPLDRETEAKLYETGNYNNATLLTQDFRRIIPKDYGLGSYKYPIWMRFVFASDNAVVWAEPLAFDRLPTYTYDADFNRSRFRSLALEIVPFQDHVGNLLTNWISATKENLQAPIFYDKEKIPAETMQKLQNLGAKIYGSRVYIPFESTPNYRMKTDQREAFYAPQLTQHNTGQIASLIAGVLDMLDRIMQLSPQEIGQAATHEQTAEETKIIAENTSTRVTFTGSFIDGADYAKKVMIYDATMAYADDEITVGISSSFAATEEEFKKLMEQVGLTISDDTTYNPEDPNAMISVTAKKSALQLETFASTRDAANRIDNPALADAMAKIFIAVASNEALITAVGPQQLVELLNQIIIAAGLPKEFRLRASMVNANASPQEQANQTGELLKGFAEQVKGAIDKSQSDTMKAAQQQTEQIVGQAIQSVVQQISPMAEAVAQNNQVNQVQQKQIDELGAAVGALNQVITAVVQRGQMAPPAAPPAPPVPVGAPA
jgi:hypothetical protein